ncbi:unnamed protein product, partial [Staurois parvus]
MTLGRKGLTCGVIKGLTGLTVWVCTMCVFHYKHTALYGSAMQSHTKQCARANRGEIC